jgi:hypothetical protein
MQCSSTPLINVLPAWRVNIEKVENKNPFKTTVLKGFYAGAGLVLSNGLRPPTL